MECNLEAWLPAEFQHVYVYTVQQAISSELFIVNFFDPAAPVFVCVQEMFKLDFFLSNWSKPAAGTGFRVLIIIFIFCQHLAEILASSWVVNRGAS